MVAETQIEQVKRWDGVKLLPLKAYNELVISDDTCERLIFDVRQERGMALGLMVEFEIPDETVKRRVLERRVVIWQNQLKLGEMFCLMLYPIDDSQGLHYEHYPNEWRIEYVEAYVS